MPALKGNRRTNQHYQVGGGGGAVYCVNMYALYVVLLIYSFKMISAYEQVVLLPMVRKF